MLDQPIDGGDGGVGLAAAGGHLDQGAGPVGGEGALQVAHRLDLRGPQAGGDQRRQRAQPGAERVGLLGPPGQRLRAVEGEHAAGARVGVAHVGEEGLDAGGLIQEGQGRVPGVGLEQRRQPGAVFRRLRFDAAQGRADRLGLDDADGAAVDEEHVVGEAGGEGELADGDAAGCAQVGRVAVLDGPARGSELPVDVPAGFLLGFHRALPVYRTAEADECR